MQKYEINDLQGAKELQQMHSTYNILVIEFYTSWCIDCKKLAPHLQELSDEYKDN